MDAAVALGAERNQVLLGIGAGMATELFVVNLKIGHRPARLTAPGIAPQHLLMQFLVGRGIKPKPLGSCWPCLHADFSVTVSRNVCF